MAVDDTAPAPTPWEEQVWRSVGEGDERALAELYEQYAPIVFGLALRVTRSEPAAEEISQEVFLSVWERPAAFDASKGTLRSWLGMLAHRRAVDWVRREVARRERQERDASAIVAPPDIEEEVVALAVADRVRRAVTALPEEQRIAVQLAYYDGQTYRQVATTLGIPEGTAKSRLRAGLHRIAEAVEVEAVERWS
jgi:RNA polymerase sigma-70 factor (ECF subfamily)